MIQTEKLLGTSTVTLTVTTNPSSATCTLTYNGNSYSSKTANVPIGTTISYSIYHSTYGTTTGTVTMDKNKTLNCTGTYSTSTTYTSWSQPEISSNGTLGGSSFAVSPSSEFNTGIYAAWHAFNSDTMATNGNNAWRTRSLSVGTLHHIIIYNPTPIKLASFSYINFGQTGISPRSGDVYGCNDGTSWNFVNSYTNSTYAVNSTWYASINSTTGYKYHKITFLPASNAGYIWCAEMRLTATQQTTSYNYYWNTTTS